MDHTKSGSLPESELYNWNIRSSLKFGVYRTVAKLNKNVPYVLYNCIEMTIFYATEVGLAEIKKKNNNPERKKE